MTDSSEMASTRNKPEGTKPNYLFEPNEDLTGISINTDSFPLWRLKTLSGIPLPVANIYASEGIPAAVDIKVADIASALQFYGKENESQWWYGLDLGMSANAYQSRRLGSRVLFQLSGGALSELLPDDYYSAKK